MTSTDIRHRVLRSLPAHLTNRRDLMTRTAERKDEPEREIRDPAAVVAEHVEPEEKTA